MSATQKIAPSLQSLVNRIISTPGGIFKSWCQRNEALRQLPFHYRERKDGPPLLFLLR
jgi:hypothetical protein